MHFLNTPHRMNVCMNCSTKPNFLSCSQFFFVANASKYIHIQVRAAREKNCNSSAIYHIQFDVTNWSNEYRDYFTMNGMRIEVECNVAALSNEYTLKNENCMCCKVLATWKFVEWFWLRVVHALKYTMNKVM